MNPPTPQPTPIQHKDKDFYFEGGLLVFTSKYLKNRGYCCGNCCRHCVYNWKKVPKQLTIKN
jgi:hypothetical protein